MNIYFYEKQPTAHQWIFFFPVWLQHCFLYVNNLMDWSSLSSLAAVDERLAKVLLNLVSNNIVL